MSFVQSLDELGLEFGLKKVIVASDFSKSVNLLQKTTDYLSERGVGPNKVTALAKIVDVERGYAIVLSSVLYTNSYDTLTRGYVILHEMAHVVNKNRFPSLITNVYSKRLYYSSLYYLYDEYFCDRFAYSVIDVVFPEKSEWWDAYWEYCVNGFASVLNDSVYSETISNAIYRFRIREIEDVDKFLSIIRQSVDEVSQSTAHLFSAVHDLGVEDIEEKLKSSRFFNDRTRHLIDYMKNKYDSEDHDLMDGYLVISEYFKNFGFLAEETSDGPFIHVLDI